MGNHHKHEAISSCPTTPEPKSTKEQTLVDSLVDSVIGTSRKKNPFTTPTASYAILPVDNMVEVIHKNLKPCQKCNNKHRVLKVL